MSYCTIFIKCNVSSSFNVNQFGRHHACAHSWISPAALTHSLHLGISTAGVEAVDLSNNRFGFGNSWTLFAATAHDATVSKLLRASSFDRSLYIEYFWMAAAHPSSPVRFFPVSQYLPELPLVFACSIVAVNLTPRIVFHMIIIQELKRHTLKYIQELERVRRHSVPGPSRRSSDSRMPGQVRAGSPSSQKLRARPP